jgi:hypothetical protein
VFAGDPAPQQLTAPCRKYQAACILRLSKRCTGEFPAFFGLFQAITPRFCEHDHSFRVRQITCGKRNLRAATAVEDAVDLTIHERRHLALIGR